MRFTILREHFLKPLRLVAGVVERKQSQIAPVLLNVLIQITETGFSLTTTDQEIALVSFGVLEEKPGEVGSVTVPVRKLMDICRALPEGAQLNFVEQGERVVIKAGRSRFTLSTLPVSDFPALEACHGDLSFSVSKSVLKGLIDQTGFAMADQDVRYYLNGMLLEVRDGKIYSVAADGHRLAFSDIVLHAETPINRKVIVPRKGVLELQRILQESEGEACVVLGNNHLRVKIDDVEMSSKLLEGKFPDYEKIVVSPGENVLTGSRELLKAAFQRAATVFTDKFKGVQLKLASGRLNILARNAEQDEVEEDLEVDYSGEPLEIGFNVKYLIDFLQVIQTEQVKLTFSDANSSARIEGVGSDNAVYVIMPMRI